MRVGRRRFLVAGIVVLVLALAAGAVEVVRPYGFSFAHPLAWREPKASEVPDNGTDTALVTVKRRSLTSRTNLDGKLGYAGKYSVVNHATGTITDLPSRGRVVEQGEVLYRVDGEPVVLLYGKAPVYRDLAGGSAASDVTGRDVRQLNRALVALGYADGLGLDPTSNEFSWATKVAVQRLQDDLGVEETGRLDLGQVVFLPGAARVTDVAATLGSRAQDGATVFTASSTRRRVVVDLAATRQEQVDVGDKVQITLPNNRTTPGRVTSVGKVAKSGGSGAPTVAVRIRPTRPSETGDLDKATVQVTIVDVTVKDALVVPVEALLALAGGGYAVEVENQEGTRRLVPVELGTFDEGAGLVQVTDTDLREGQRVVVPST